ncbi:MAG TPA: YbaK/EbsC family protein [Vicinamibacteria bacterium]|nr:YbaK/EbsC family protein [Vicinamibacteria bacterium]
MSERLSNLLASRRLDFHVVPYHDAIDAQHVASACHVRGREMAKVLVVRDADGQFLMVAIPAGRRLDLAAVQRATGRMGLRLATEQEFGPLFPDCQLGAMPPFPELYDVPVLVDGCLQDSPEIYFRGGSHHELVGMRFLDYANLAHPTVSAYCYHRTPRSA